MVTKRSVLEVLSRGVLSTLVDEFELESGDRRVKGNLVDALARSRKAGLSSILEMLKRDDLKEICRAHGLDDSGRAKAGNIARILAGGRGSESKGGSCEASPKRGMLQGEYPAPREGTGRGSQQGRSRGGGNGRGNGGGKGGDRGRANQKAAGDTKEQRQASLGFENKLWEAADLLRNNMDPAEYKHIVLGLLFLKYITDAFEERREALQRSVSEPSSEYYVEDPSDREAELEELLEDRDEYMAENVFWVPREARWGEIQAQAKQPQIGKVIDDAMDAIERENPRLKGALPKRYGLPGLDKYSLGKLIDLFSNIGLGTKEHQDKDTLGRVYEYFLAKFASAEGKGGGEFYTPVSIVRVLVAMLEPYRGRVYDPCCGSGGMFVQSLKFIEAHNGRRNQITVYGQESNRTTWRMARMNLAIRGIEANLGKKHADSFHEDLHPDLRADYVLANPPFNISQWGGERLEEDVRWKYGRPPAGNANFAWVQHFIYHLAPTGTAGFVLANGSMSSMSSGEGDIRQRMVEADLVDAIVACPGQLFYATQIPVCLWFLTKNKAGNGHRRRFGETLFIDARKLGRMETRVHRVLDEEDIEKIAGTYHAWRNKGGKYKDISGFCKSATLEEIKSHDYVLTPGRYVGAEEVEDDGEPFEEKMERLTETLREQIEEGNRLDRLVGKSIKSLNF